MREILKKIFLTDRMKNVQLVLYRKQKTKETALCIRLKSLYSFPSPPLRIIAMTIVSSLLFVLHYTIRWIEEMYELANWEESFNKEFLR